MEVVEGVMCKLCFDVLLPADSRSCRCGTCAILQDTDGHTHLYVDLIHNAQRIRLYMHEGDEVTRELLRPFSKEAFVDYNGVASTPITYKPPVPKNDYVRKTSTKYNTALVKALNRYKHTTADDLDKRTPDRIRNLE